jgi:hypothetical protein
VPGAWYVGDTAVVVATDEISAELAALVGSTVTVTIVDGVVVDVA